MQREIKCRGLLKSDGKTWVVGAYYKHEKVTLCPMGLTDADIKENELHLIINGGFSDWNLPAGLKCYEVIPETIGLYTGVRDKNSKELFEGDIYHKADKNTLYVVVWNGTSLIGQQLKTERYSILTQGQEYFEIIGNSTDNPELL